ncbi:hypothetical protein HanIR_Chr03g0108491 [Helianthus annuus]|nr:hypothetical protein HanIR_Chr03g0108491 [Helianthus annuus]
MVGGGGPLDRKRINDALGKQLEKTSSSSTSRFLNKEKDRIYMPSTSAAGGGGCPSSSRLLCCESVDPPAMNG